jgi:chitinase
VTSTPRPRLSARGLDSTPSATAEAAAGPTRLVGYLASWSLGASYGIADVPARLLSHLIYAFAAISSAGECVPGSTKSDPLYLPQLAGLKQRNPQLKTLISIGGGGGDANFPLVVQSSDAIQHFAASAVQFMTQYGFDGIDIDWEYPVGDHQKQGLTALLAELRRQLDQKSETTGAPYLLTLAAPAGIQNFASFDFASINRSLDWFNVMTYAFHGNWEKVTNFDAPLYATQADPSPFLQRMAYNTDAVVRSYLALDLPPDKLVVGMPFFGYGWKGVPDVNNGLYQPATSPGDGTHARGVYDYRDIAQRLIGALPRYWHGEAQVPWLYDPTLGVMISYDDAQSLAIKADYVRSQKLGGAMIWEISTDDTQHSLVTALATHLRGSA